MSERRIETGTRLFFGAPANPTPKSSSDAIGDVISRVRGIEEAHLPQCFVEGDAQAHQVLVIGVRSKAEIPRIAKELMPGLNSVIADGRHLDLLPLETSSIPQEVRAVGCQIFIGAKNRGGKYGEA